MWNDFGRQGWFEALFGFAETDRQAVYDNLSVEGAELVSHATGRRFGIGTLTTPSLSALRSQVGAITEDRPLRARQIVADVSALHQDPRNIGAMFQVASQFNLLEMVSPYRTPDDGITGYISDRTQGPACAIAAAPATVYRNYFVPVGDQQGQRRARQLDMLSDIGDVLGNDDERLWEMRNGYALASAEGLAEISMRLETMDPGTREALKGRLRIGIHADVEVTVGQGGGPVSQAYCSALPVAYSRLPSQMWAPFARLVLEAAYEATFCAALLRAREGGSSKLFLTMLGGGAFGNRPGWILDAVGMALRRFARSGLEVSIVSYRMADPGVDGLLWSMGLGEE